MERIAQGAEAKIYADAENELIIKERFSKSYRHPVIDESLRRARTRREAKVIEKMNQLQIASPALLSMDDSRMTLNMRMIDGDQLRDILYQDPLGFSKELGRKIGLMHQNDIIHGDLTTSNMIISKETKKLHMIDFGLSFFSHKAEDKAVDLHLLRQSLESKHYNIWENAFKAVLSGYKESYPDYKEVLERFNKVEQRGRNKLKG